MTTLKSDCRKFSPNIFNKTKCQNCFRTKDAHSAEALESNRATRKVSKCGYLFVAPDWDFSVSINRTKRWQRRWFVLYDDGELTYSVDEHPDTVPQAVIDMNKVLEVSDAEDVTGNQFAIAITAPEKVHFVKGTSREESRWWFDVLSRFPRNTVRGKHKRNATFPGGKATTTPVSIISDHEPNSEHLISSTDDIARPRFLSTSEPPRNNRKDWSWLQADHNDEDVFPTKDTPEYENSCPELSLTTDQPLNGKRANEVDVNNALNKLITSSTALNSNNHSGGRPILLNKITDKDVNSEVINTKGIQGENKSPLSDLENAKKARSRRYQKRENRGCRNQRSRSDGVAKMIPGRDYLVESLSKTTDFVKESFSDKINKTAFVKDQVTDNNDKVKRSQDDSELKTSPSKESFDDDTSKSQDKNSVYLLISENADPPVSIKRLEGGETVKQNGSLSPVPTRKRHTSDKESNCTKGGTGNTAKETSRPSRPLKKSESLMNIASESATEIRHRISELKRYHSYKGSPSMYRDKQNPNSPANKTAAFITAIRPVRDTDPKPHVPNEVGDKRTSGLPINSSFWQSGLNVNAEDMFIKKGWLLRQTFTKDWSRHWFVLKNSSLTYYRDPSAEDCGILDGVLDLNQITKVEEMDSDKYFPFCLIMWDNKKHILSAVTAGIRSNWIQAIQYASDLWDSSSRKDFCKDEIILPEHTFHSLDSKSKNVPINEKCPAHVSAPSSPIPSLETDKLDVSSSDDQSEYFSIIDEEEGGDRSSSPRPLPPSPPVNRTAMSLVKERARTRSNSYSQLLRQNSFSSMPDCSESKTEQHSDETNSDNSAAQESPLWQRKEYYQDICNKLFHTQLDESKSLKDQTIGLIPDDSSKDIKCEASGSYRMKLLQKRCKDLENQLALKSKEISDKVLELGAFGNLKTYYQDLVEQNKYLRKKLVEGNETSKSADDNYQLKYEILRMKYLRDRAEWESRLKKEKGHSSKDGGFDTLVRLLMKAKQVLSEVNNKSCEFKSESNTDILIKVKQLLEEIEKFSPFLERRAKRESDMKKLRKTLNDLQVLCDKRQQILQEEQNNYTSLKSEIEKKNELIQDLQQQLQSLKAGNQENSNTRALKSLDDISLSCSEFNSEELHDTDVDMCNKCQKWKAKFDLAREKILMLKKELKDSHASHDDLEIVCFKLKQELKNKDENHKSQISLMTARVDDLTSKYTLSERNLRQLKQKMAKVESKQERRRSSLKNKESLTLSKEYETKLLELERKISNIEGQVEEKKVCKENDSIFLQDSQIDGEDSLPVSDRHLTKRLSQDSNSGSENMGLLLRLHTLNSRVKSVSDTVEKQIQENVKDSETLDRPKICVQVRNEEENSAHDECGEDWSTLSYATSLADLQAIDGLDGDFPCSLSECLECLGHKLEGILLWIKATLNLIQKQDFSLFTSSKTCSYNKDIASLAAEITEVLDSLLENKLDEVAEITGISEVVKFFYKILLLNEIAQILYKMANVESKTVLERLNILKFSFVYINKNLLSDALLSNSVNKDYSNINNSKKILEKLIFLCDAPWESFQSDMIDFSYSQEESCDRFKLFQELLEQINKLLKEEKENKFSTLWQIVTDVPVQDTEKEFQNIFIQNCDFHDCDPLFLNIIFMVNSLFHNAKQVLSTSEYKNLSILQCEYEAWNEWCLHVTKTIEQEQLLFIDELKNFFNRAGESSLYCSRFSLSVYQKIVFTVFELLHVVLSVTVIQSVLTFLINKENIHEENSCKNWLSLLHENYHQHAILLTHEKSFTPNLNSISACSILNCVTEIGAKEIEMAGQINAIQHLYKKEMDNLYNENNKLVNKNCQRCKEIASEVLNLQEELEQKLKGQNYCQSCIVHKIQLESASEQHELELSLLQKQHKDKIDELHRHLQLVLQQKDEIHLKEVQKLEEELQSAHKRLKHMEVEYDEQIRNLRELYEQKLSLKHDPINEESVRQRYQTEIEQLKGLCEKGLVVMENSHRRITMELERRHKQELTMLEAEKEKVLAEETQATLTALEVMRKAHAEELQRKIARFKEEFTQKMQSSLEAEQFFEKHGELEEIKHDILSVSEKYSIKCLENASLEEKVQALCQQLQEANHQLFDLMARNKQLKVHLAMDITQKKESLENKEKLQTAEDLKMLLQLRESELAESREMNAQLKQELYLAQMHVSMLDVQCEQLQQSLKAERRLREDEVSSLKTKLDAIISASSVGSQENLQSVDRNYRSTKLPSRRNFLYRSPSLNLPRHILELATARVLTSSSTKELLRSPSCPKLQNSTHENVLEAL